LITGMEGNVRVVRNQLNSVVLLALLAFILVLPASAEGTSGVGEPSLLSPGNNGTFSPVLFEDGKPILYFFFNRNCGECVETLPYVEEYGSTHQDVVIHPVDIRENDENLALFQSFKEYYGTGAVPVPAVFVRNVSLTGKEEIT